MLRFSITTLGCKVNQYDGCAVAATLRRAGMEAVQPPDQPALVVINTCCVTTTAMRKSRNAIRRAVRRTPNAAILIAGCYSDYDAERIRNLLADLGVGEHRAIVAGHHDDLAGRIRQLLSYISAQEGDPGQRSRCSDSSADAKGNELSMSAGPSARIAPSRAPTTIMARRQAAVKRNRPGTATLGPIDRFDNHQRAFVKVQDGCDAFCAYCIVPYTRPVVWSRSIQQIEDECKDLVRAGHREIVLAGVFLGAFGRDTAVRRRWDDAPPALPVLVERIAAIEGLWRVRLSSLEPADVSDELLAVCRLAPNVAPHFHLPLQSGSQRILSRMNRQYTADRFRGIIDRLRDAFDRPALTTDIIVGFPGETDADFAETLAMVRYAGFAKVHAFPFSAVEGTAAWTYRTEAPPRGVVKSRMAALAALEGRTAAAYRRQFVGQEMEALVEKARNEQSHLDAMTDRYITVAFMPPPGADLTGTIVRVRIDDLSDKGLRGTLLS